MFMPLLIVSLHMNVHDIRMLRPNAPGAVVVLRLRID